MSNAERKSNLPAIIQTAEATFTQLARRHNVPDFTFEREAAFALQILKKNEYLANIACGNPDSLKEAIINVAAVGLSLSPVHKQAYLVPRKNEVCLDISYQGLVDLVVNRGAIQWAKAVLVHDNDEFAYIGVNKEPDHRFEPFGERGTVVGGYCLAKMPTGDLLVDFMSIHEIYNIRDRSDGWKSFKAGKAKMTPWNTDEGEMIKKTLIKRAYKSWPRALVGEVMNKALDVTNSVDGIDFEAEAAALPAPASAHKTEGIEIIREYLEALDKEEPAYIAHLCKTTNRTIKELEDLTDLEVDQAVTFLQSLVDKQAARLNKLKGNSDENVG